MKRYNKLIEQSPLSKRLREKIGTCSGRKAFKTAAMALDSWYGDIYRCDFCNMFHRGKKERKLVEVIYRKSCVSQQRKTRAWSKQFSDQYKAKKDRSEKSGERKAA